MKRVGRWVVLIDQPKVCLLHENQKPDGLHSLGKKLTRSHSTRRHLIVRIYRDGFIVSEKTIIFSGN